MHPTALSFANILNRTREHAIQVVKEAVDYNKTGWDKTHKETQFKLGEEVPVSTVNFNNLQGPKKLQDPLVGPFFITKLLVWMNGIMSMLVGYELMAKAYRIYNLETRKVVVTRNVHFNEMTFPFAGLPSPSSEKKCLKILKEKRIKENNTDKLLYLVRYKHRSADEDEWLPADKIPNFKVTLRAYRAAKRVQIHNHV
ncbi:hypothetical protein CROQUDRAFT_38297 [Cronartium quercuum f. sp. fusiforme G11]|uniref:Retroviral polymerase SH3-like domain-containing protein n=1 Tax=Cronartium quercuum f. sp. fusiforme G11 TaxID=708437 RepID=A0A9P6NNN4_9BASI|nr:hypothetical protein CROQUDRAFT_38297 [Cronartium quercuum f. sp. fusiforme G11]